MVLSPGLWGLMRRHCHRPSPKKVSWHSTSLGVWPKLAHICLWLTCARWTPADGLTFETMWQTDVCGFISHASQIFALQDKWLFFVCSAPLCFVIPMWSSRAVTVKTEQRILTSHFHHQNSLENRMQITEGKFENFTISLKSNEFQDPALPSFSLINTWNKMGVLSSVRTVLKTLGAICRSNSPSSLCSLSGENDSWVKGVLRAPTVRCILLFSGTITFWPLREPKETRPSAKVSLYE